MVAEDGNVLRSVRLSHAPSSSVHAEIASEGIEALLLETAGKDRIALVERRAESRVVRVEIEKGIDRSVGGGGDGGGNPGANLLRRVDTASTERSSFVEVGCRGKSKARKYVSECRRKR